MKKKEFTALGVMSGTSIDGIDISLIKSDGFAYFSSILDGYYEFEDYLKSKLIDLRNKINSLNDIDKYSSELSKLEREFTLFHARIINEILKDYSGTVDLIGFHGQTIYHNPEKKISLQLGDGKLLSQLTKKTVINNFRQNDLNNGGQGAPLIPIFHKLLIKILEKNFSISFPINIINIGGITNVTKIIDNEILSTENIDAFDIGPGNCLIDEWVRKNSKKYFDENGDLAKSGKVNELVLNQAIENFSNFSYHKSLDVKDFDISFARGLSLEDGCATLAKFSAYLISKGLEEINNFDNKFSKMNILCGGGRKNNFLVENLRNFLSTSEIEVINIDNYNLNGDYIESQGFGYLSIRSFLGLPISFPKTTRCKSPTSGGIINKNFEN